MTSSSLGCCADLFREVYYRRFRETAAIMVTAFYHKSSARLAFSYAIRLSRPKMSVVMVLTFLE